MWGEPPRRERDWGLPIGCAVGVLLWLAVILVALHLIGECV